MVKFQIPTILSIFLQYLLIQPVPVLLSVVVLVDVAGHGGVVVGSLLLQLFTNLKK